MSVLKNLDINLPQSEKTTLFRFLALYTFFTLVILALTGSLYYSMQKELATSQRTILLDEYANEFLIALEELQNDTTDTLLYPVDKKFKTSLYGKDYKLIYSTLSNPQNLLSDVKYTSNKIIRYVNQPEKYYLHTQYIIVEILDDKEWFDKTIKTLIFYSFVFFLFMLIVGFFLVKLFLKPMRDALHLLDRFIKDTTHELNTPVSTIMTNIELIDKESIQDKYLLKSINRIDIGAKTISNIYDDLSYLILNNKIISKNQDINLEKLLQERVEYFLILADIKKIRFITELDADVILHIDNTKMIKLIDNILSNAIKYNKIGGSIFIYLDKNSLSIKDTGRGIKQEHIDSMFDRYSRFDNSVGGFGIGLNIVKMICDEYKLAINIESKLDQYTQITITF